MRKKRGIRSYPVLALLLAAALTLAGCGGGGGGQNEQPQPSPGESAVSVWSAPATVKILRTEEYAEAQRGPAELTVRMAKNEYESAQLVLTPEESGVSAYDLTTADLIGPDGAKIPAKDVAVFHQKYVDTKVRSNTTFLTGSYPDALLPLDVAKAYGENKVAAGENQGIWVRFRTQADTPAGEYAATFRLVTDGTSREISVRVTVWDFAVSEKSHARTLFNLYPDMLTLGEGDSSDEMLKKYYDFFLDYRVNLTSLPAKSTDTEKLVELVRKYAVDPKVTAWSLPWVMDNKAGGVDFARQQEFLAKVVRASVEDEINYLEKAVFYNIMTDEYSMGDAVKQQFSKQQYQKFASSLAELGEKFDSALGEEYLDSVPGLRDSLLHVGDLSVSGYVTGVTECASIICPSFGYFNTQQQRDFYASLAAEEFKELWWYGCVGPTYPYPTYHIDDVLFSSRLASWMQYDYGVVGNLYWQTVSYSNETGSGEFINPYEDPNRFGTNNGDGYLVYPGSYYGIDGPVGTIRLESIRDGMEEYEYLYLLDHTYQGLSEYYGGVELDYRDVVQEMYDSMYINATVYKDFDVSVIENNRVALAGYIESAVAEEKLLVESIASDRDTVTVNVLLSGGAALTPNENLVSTQQAGEGKRYTFRFPVNDSDQTLNMTYTINGVTKTFRKVVAKGVHELSGMNTDGALSLITVSEGGSKELATLDGARRAHVKLSAKPADPDFAPYFDLALDSFATDADVLQLEIYCAGDTATVMELEYWTNTKVVPAGSVRLRPGWNSVQLDLSTIGPANVTDAVFKFPNTGGAELYLGRLLYRNR